jgi:transcriptional regulator with XRE-family HTH domain
MIRTDAEYQEAKNRLAQERKRLGEHQEHLRAMSLAADDVERAINPLRSFQLQLEEDVAEYEAIKGGRIQELVNLHGLGHTLVATRIALGMTQRQLAERLGVNESQVSRDERNEYRGITVERAARVLEALGAEVNLTVSVKARRCSVKARLDDKERAVTESSSHGARAVPQIG